MKNRLTTKTAQKLTIAILLSSALATAAEAGVVINEMLASNKTCSINGRTHDWIELFNTDTASVDLSGYRIETASGKKFTFSKGTIQGKGIYCIACTSGNFDKAPKSKNSEPPFLNWFTNQSWNEYPGKEAFDWTGEGAEPDINTGFNIPANGDTIYLYAPGATTACDSIDFGPQATDYSVGRFPDGTGSFCLCTTTLGAANVAQVLSPIAGVKVNECTAGPDDWFELYNSGANPVAIGGCYLTTKPSKDPKMFQIPALTFIGNVKDAFQVYYADEDTAAGKDHVNFKLGKGGDKIAIIASNGTQIDKFEYPECVDYEVYGRIPDGGKSVVKQPGLGTAGASNYLELTDIVLSEIFTHSDFDEGVTDPDFIELQNISQSAIDISGWGISDSEKNFFKYVFPTGTVIQPGKFLTVTELEFDDETNPNCRETFRLNSYEGDSTYLTQVKDGKVTGYRCQVTFGAAPNNYSFIRNVNTDGLVHYPLSQYTTMDKANAPVQIGPIVINEIHYKPAGATEPTVDEFIEIFNITDQEVPLYYTGRNGKSDPRPSPAARFANAIDYTFPDGTTLPPGGYAIVVSFNPNGGTAAEFRAKFNVPEDIPLYGPYSGKLSNDGETIEFQMPDKPEEDGFVPYYVADAVGYKAAAPWSEKAKGTGYSLQKTDAFVYGNQSTSWGVYTGADMTLAVTPGKRSSVGTTDHDSDGMPSDWELKYQFNPYNPTDANEDANGDGITNLQHYLNGTNPRETIIVVDPVKLSVSASDGTLTIRFEAQKGVTYVVEKAANINGEWIVFTTLEKGEARTESVNDVIGAESPCFYRVIGQ